MSLVGAKDNLTNMDHFWQEMVKVTGPVSTTVRAALDRTKFIHSGLQLLDDPTIDAVEADIRRLPALLRISEKEAARMVAYPGDIKEFRFLVGERSVMKLIATKVQQYGFNCFYHPVKQAIHRTVVEQSSDTPLEETIILEAEEEVVRNKIREHYDRKSDGSDEHVDFCLKLANVGVEIRQNSNGDAARIICPFCDQNTTIIRRDKTGTWRISNFAGHIKYKHGYLDYPGKEVVAETTDSEDVSTSSLIRPLKAR
ncbi:uncharacterized protein LOC131683934 [Topomyia yanbarensis]|uniref:uncharacterized protein LOC131683934 n=1 Tax=Topomyia yanbarensis TaxID=2498891 RepID=UPI00273ADF58|nr:uncharacterized protein LOC131683934 [Topomyia yanbarensis]